LLQVFYSDFYLSTLLDRDKNNKWSPSVNIITKKIGT
jgi:hypothetical protein